MISVTLHFYRGLGKVIPCQGAVEGCSIVWRPFTPFYKTATVNVDYGNNVLWDTIAHFRLHADIQIINARSLGVASH